MPSCNSKGEAALIQQVNAQLEPAKPAPQVASKNQ
jgi:hypothetical protein